MFWWASMRPEAHGQARGQGPVGAARDGRPAAARTAALVCALEDLGLACAVEVEDGVALLLPRAGASMDRLAEPTLAREVVAAARAHGFPRVALVIGDR